MAEEFSLLNDILVVMLTSIFTVVGGLGWQLVLAIALIEFALLRLYHALKDYLMNRQVVPRVDEAKVALHMKDIRKERDEDEEEAGKYYTKQQMMVS